jgi:hypothetical protein
MGRGGRALAPVLVSGASLLWGLLVLSAGFWFPAYRSGEETCGPDGDCGAVGESSSTLVAVNGAEAVYALAVPVVASALMIGIVLAPSWARWAGWGVVAGMWALTALGMASIGCLFVPSALLLTAAVLLVQMSRTTEPQAPG